MLKREDPANELDTLAEDLRRIKPEGWSVVIGSNDIIVRPKNRTTGKFRISFVSNEKCSVMFFSRELNYWNKSSISILMLPLPLPLKNGWSPQRLTP